MLLKIDTAGIDSVCDETCAMSMPAMPDACPLLLTASCEAHLNQPHYTSMNTSADAHLRWPLTHMGKRVAGCEVKCRLWRPGVIGGGFGAVEAIKRLGLERRLFAMGKYKAALDPFKSAQPFMEDTQDAASILWTSN